MFYKCLVFAGCRCVTTNTMRRPSVGLMLGQRHRRRPNVEQTQGQCHRVCWCNGVMKYQDYIESLRDREVACSALDRQGSNFESCVWRTVSSHNPQEVLLAQFSLYVHKGGLKPDSFHFILHWVNKYIIIAMIYTNPYQAATNLN